MTQGRQNLTVEQHADAKAVLLSRAVESDIHETRDDGMTFFMHYVAVCVILVLTMASVLDPYAVLIGVALTVTLGATVWLITSLAEIFNEYTNSGE